MALNVTCAGCQSVYPVAESLIGKTIRCKKCGEMMPVEAAAAPVAKAVAAKAVAAKPAARVVVADDGDARPAKPARRPRDEDDEDARPARGKAAPEKKKSALPLIL